MADRNRRFLETLDASYFEWAANVFSPSLDSSDSHRAALALRIHYGHALETLFAVLGAVIQAPGCVFGWLDQYRTSELLELIKKITNAEPVHSHLKTAPLTWQGLADAIHVGLVFEDKDYEEGIKQGFGILWRRFAHDFLDVHQRSEYNSLKHGLRVTPGGFTLRMGESDNPDSMRTIGESRYGSTYHVLEAFDASSLNFTSRMHSRNWMPNNYVRGLRLVSISLNNVIAWAQHLNGHDPSGLKIRYPEGIEEFQGPWEETPGAVHSSLDITIEEQDLEPVTAEEILEIYQP